MRKLLALLAILPGIAFGQSYTTFPNLQSGNVNFTATIRANGGACASGEAIVSGSGTVSCVELIPASEKGANSGVATLDSGGKVPTSQLPFAGLSYEGSWNATTNSPTLADGVGTGGDFYITSVAGTQDLGSGNITFAVGDWALYNGSVWQKVPSSAAVTSVFGRTGAVTATAGDYTATQVTNTPAGGISATDAQAAINELDTEKQAAASTLTSWAALTRASGFDTFTQTPSSANLRGLLTDETGTGLSYFQGGALGTPASGTLTNATGLPWSTGLTGLPTTAVGYGITGGAKLDAWAGGDTPSAFTLGIVDSADAATWRSALGAGTSSFNGDASTLTGTLADARLSSNVPLKNATNTFTASQTFTTSSGWPVTGTPVSDPSAFTGATPLAYRASGGGTTTYTGYDFTDTATPKARIAAIFSVSGSTLTLGTSNNYTTGITNSALSIGPTGAVSVAAPSSGTGLTVNGGLTLSSGALTLPSASIADASLSSNVPLKNGANVFTQMQRIAYTGSNEQLRLNHDDATLTFYDAANSALSGYVRFRAAATSRIWIQANQALQIGTNNTDRMTIAGDGNVTINAPSSGGHTINGGLRLGSPTGGDKGAGTLNAAGGIYQNNVSVCLNDGTNCGVLNASNISSGTLNNSRLPSTINAATDVQVGGVSVCQSNGTNCPGGVGASVYGVVPTGQGGSCAVDTSYNSAGISSCGDATTGHVSVNFTSAFAKKPVCVATVASLTSTAETVTITSISTTGVSFWLFVSSTGALINGSVSFTCT